jgi:chromosome partitioning protein
MCIKRKQQQGGQNMAKILVFASEKGGSGKTTTALAFSAGLQARGYTVLRVDLDGQGNFSRAFSPDSDNKADAVTAYDVLLDPYRSADEAIQHLDEGDIITANKRMVNADQQLRAMEDGALSLKDKLGEVSGDYDYIVIDTSPTISLPTISAMIAADHIIIPTQADVFGLDGVGELYKTYVSIKERYNNKLSLAGILLTRCSRNILTRDISVKAAAMAQRIGTFLYTVQIRENIAIKEAQAMRQSIFEYAARSHGAEDYGAAIDEYLERMAGDNGKEI